MRMMGVASIVVVTAAGVAAGQTPLGSLPTTAGGPYGPRTVIPATIACTDVPTTAEPVSTLRVLAPHAADEHEAVTRGALVVLNGGTPQGLLVGQRYFTRRLELPLHYQPMSAAERGSIRTSGWLTVVAADEHFALARIDYACTAILAGDYLEPYVEPALPAVAAAGGSTNFADLARVLTGADRREIFGSGDVLSIDRGSSAGVSPGARVAFYRDREDGTPLVELATGIVVDVREQTSAVVVERSVHDVRMGDYVGFRPAP